MQVRSVNREAVAGSEPDTEPVTPLSTVVPAGSATHAPTESVDDGVAVAELVGVDVEVGVEPSDMVGVPVAVPVAEVVMVEVKVANAVRVPVDDLVDVTVAVPEMVVLELAPKLRVADGDEVGDGIVTLHITPSAELLAPKYMPTRV